MANRQKSAFLSNLRFLLQLTWRYKKSTVPLICLAALANAGVVFIGILFPKLILDEITGNGRLQVVVLFAAAAGAGLFLLRQVDFWCKNRFTLEAVWFHAIIQAGETFMDMPYELTDDPDVITKSSRAEELLENAGDGVLGSLNTLSLLLEQGFAFLLSLTIVITLHPALICCFLALSALVYLAGRGQNRKIFALENRMAPFARKAQYLFDFMTDYASGKELRIFNLRGLLDRHYRHNAEEILRLQKKRNAADCKLGSFSYLISILQELAIYGYLIFRVVAAGLTIGSFTMYVAAARTFCQNALELFQSAAKLSKQIDGVGLIREFIGLRGDGKTPGETAPPPPYELTFEHVSFRYPGQESYVLRDVSFTLHAGERLAIVGSNGAGKTTMTKLLMGLYDPTEGRVLLNGRDVRGMDKADYYRLFAPVFQDIELYALPLCANVSLRSGEETDPARAEASLRRANLSYLLDRLPEGLQTPLLRTVDPNGLELSGGEKQRVALARAIYKDAPFLILDEPSSALDPLAEQALYEEFDRIVSGKSTIFISHRLASVSFCDRVALFDQGRLLEYGTHGELLAQEGEYAAMYASQAKYYREVKPCEAV